MKSLYALMLGAVVLLGAASTADAQVYVRTPRATVYVNPYYNNYYGYYQPYQYQYQQQYYYYTPDYSRYPYYGYVYPEYNNFYRYGSYYDGRNYYRYDYGRRWR